MTNVAEVALIASVAESGLARIAPTISGRLAAELPEIFGSPFSSLARSVAHSPETAKTVLQIGEAYQGNLTRFGLRSTATPHELYSAARQSGLEPIQTASHRGMRNSSSAHELVLGDGFMVKTAGRSDRHAAQSSAIFLNPNIDGKLIFETVRSKVSGRSAQWTIETPNFTRTVKVRDY